MKTVTNLSAGTALAVAMALPTATLAQEYDTTDSVVTVNLLDGWRDVDGTHFAGIEITLAPGWKTYWRAPGDGGLPTHLNWSRSSNLQTAKVHWPRPDVFRVAGLRSIGYADHVILPVEISPQTGGEIAAKLDIAMGVCKDICIPVHLSIEETLSVAQSENIPLIETAMSQIPPAHDTALSCNIIEVENGYLLDVATTLPPLEGQGETAVVELPGQPVWISEPYFARDENWIISTVRMSAHGAPYEIDLDELRLTVLTTTSAVELQGCR